MLGFSANTVSNHRQLLIFTAPASQREYMKQLAVLSTHQPEVDERDLIIRAVGPKDIDRSYYNIPEPDFCIMLVGKDGTEKYRSKIAIEPDKLFDLIDKMPMRINEMRNKEK